jgi:hypothetical protein
MMLDSAVGVARRSIFASGENEQEAADQPPKG